MRYAPLSFFLELALNNVRQNLADEDSILESFDQALLKIHRWIFIYKLFGWPGVICYSWIPLTWTTVQEYDERPEVLGILREKDEWLNETVRLIFGRRVMQFFISSRFDILNKLIELIDEVGMSQRN